MITNKKLSRQHDVSITNPENSDLLSFNSATNKWKNSKELAVDTNKPTGWSINSDGVPDISKSGLTYDINTLSVTITVTGNSFSYYLRGTKYISTESISCNFTNTKGAWYFYIDVDTNTFTASQSITEHELILKQCKVAQGYWSVSKQDFLLGLNDERHGINMSQQSHLMQHEIGTRLESGGGLYDFDIVNDPLFSIELTEIWDEDKKYAQEFVKYDGEWKCFHRTSATTWDYTYNLDSSLYPYLISNSNALLQYRNLSYELTDVPEGKYCLYHIYVTMFINGSTQFYLVVGTKIYDTVDDAVVGQQSEIENLKRSQLPNNESVFLGSLIFKSVNGFVHQAEIQTYQLNGVTQNYIDSRYNKQGFTSENIANKTSTLDANSTTNQYPNAKATFDLFSSLVTGVLPQDPVEMINLTGSTDTWITPTVEGDAYILQNDAQSDFYNEGYNFVDGDVVQVQNSDWVKVKTLTLGDRFIVEGVNSTTPAGLLAGDKNKIVTCTNATPGSIAFSKVAVANSMITFVQNPNALYYDVIYVYNSTSVKWVRISGSYTVTYGSGLKVTSNVLNLDVLLANWNAGNFNIQSATFNEITLTKNATGFSISGGTSSKTLTLTDNASISGINSGDETAATIKTKLGITAAQEQLNGTGFVKATGTTISYDNNTYITGNQSISLGSEASGSGTTNIAVTLANAAVIGKVLTGLSTTPGTIADTDSILSAIGKLIGNITHTIYSATPVDPGTTSSTVGVMMGLAIPFTPTTTGKIRITITGDVDNATNARGSQYQIRYGTGTAPNNGVALTGTAIGALQKFFNNNANERSPFTLIYPITGLTLNTSIWVDISLASITGGTSRVRDLAVVIEEI